ncbi:hypothetical protein TGAM01_v210312 [Trichoderma gamsii]|uniref:Histone deacetylase complex subunit SAP18 n=1 Tax=Trichoderma gamsii TaxID=398673 RepID=A0A2P4Z936_9HYPO|nr:hypothetical protein TGAM01_v210312 [Trichoderma gamsii]PON20803.1 hypothetical protein TGAM01_v210312 [Trichoderma gamsii]
MSATKGDDDHDASPFLVRLFHKTGSFPRPEEFASSSLPPYVSIYTWSTCTLNELALELAAAKPNALPNPAIGTRLSFQLVCPDLRGASATSTTQPKFAVKELGSIVIGEGYPGAEDPEDAGPDTLMRDDFGRDKTLADWRFVVGDYISCAGLLEEGRYLAGEMGAAVDSEVGFMVERAILAATMVVQTGQVGEITGFRQANGEEENSYQMGRLEGQGAGAAGRLDGMFSQWLRLRKGYDIPQVI